jgi:hypothetical protein
MSNLDCLILDDADELGDERYLDKHTSVLAMLPAQNTRQTLIFSAAMPELAMPPRYQIVDCVGKDDSHKPSVSHANMRSAPCSAITDDG